MQDTPLVSFIVISYKHEKYIADCLESILAQTYGNMEILYLDDASGDGTFDRACTYRQRFEEKYTRVEYICNADNQGIVKNLNRLLQICRGDYIKILAADDFMLCDGIEMLVALLEQHTEYDMVYSNGISGDENTRYPLNSVDRNKLLYKGASPQGNDCFQLLYENDFIAAPGVMIRASTYRLIGPYDCDIGVEDWDYFLRIARVGTIGYLSSPTVMYRMLSSSVSHSSDPKRRINMKRSELKVLEKHKDNIDQAEKYIGTSLNEALQDAFHIDDKDYMSYLFLYAERNKVKISYRNKMKYVLYKAGVIKFMNWLR